MRDKKYTCGKIYPSGCVVYTGTLPDFLPSDSVSCDANIDEIIQKYGETIDSILNNSDLTELEPLCLDFDPDTITIKDLHQLEIDRICNHEVRITSLELPFDIGSKLVEIDLDCLESEAAPCEQAPDTYTLLSILLAYRSEICQLKAAVALLS